MGNRGSADLAIGYLKEATDLVIMRSQAGDAPYIYGTNQPVFLVGRPSLPRACLGIDRPAASPCHLKSNEFGGNFLKTLPVLPDA